MYFFPRKLVLFRKTVHLTWPSGGGCDYISPAWCTGVRRVPWGIQMCPQWRLRALTYHPDAGCRALASVIFLALPLWQDTGASATPSLALLGWSPSWAKRRVEFPIWPPGGGRPFPGRKLSGVNSLNLRLLEFKKEKIRYLSRSLKSGSNYDSVEEELLMLGLPLFLCFFSKNGSAVGSVLIEVTSSSRNGAATIKLKYAQRVAMTGATLMRICDSTSPKSGCEK